MHRRLLLGAACASLWAGLPAHAQSVSDDEVRRACPVVDDEPGLVPRDGSVCEPLEEIVVVGERIGVAELDDLTSPASVITRDDLAARDPGALTDALRAVPGLAVSRNGSALGLTQLRLRGAEANQIVVLIDGVEVANPADGAFDFGGLRAADVLRVEVLRGEQSALYGSDAVGGVLNIVTRAALADPGWQASVEAGSRGTVEGQVSAVVPLSSASLSINGTAFSTDGYDISGTGGRDDGGSSEAINLGLNGLALGDVELSARYGYIRRDNDFDEDSDFDGRLNDTDGRVEVETRTARLEGRWYADAVTVLAAVSRVETETDTRAGFPTRTAGERDQATLAVEAGSDVHNLTLLGEYEREGYSFEGDPDTPSNDTWGTAADYRFALDDLTLTASARYDSNDLFDDAVTWRAGAGYATPVGRFTASAGTAVKNPTLIELFGFFPSANFVGNADLRPEESFGYNLGWSYDLGLGRVAVNYFRSELDDEIVTIFNPDFTTGVANLETESTREGVEIEGRYDFGDVDIRGSASFLDADQDSVEEVRRPDFLASASVSWDMTDTVRASLFVDHTGAQLDTDFATFTNVELDSFTLVGANVSYDVTDAWSIFTRGENLLDEDYEEVVGYRSPGAALFVGLRADY